MRKIVLCIAIISTATAVKAQSFAKGDNVISAGIGFGSAIGDYGFASQAPAVSVQYEKGIWPAGPGVVSLGGYAGVKTYRYSGSSGGYSYTQKWNYTIIGVRGAWHYTEIPVEKLDVYAGAMVSYNILKYKYSDNTGYSDEDLLGGSYGSAVGVSAFAGARYYFAGNLSVFAELGYGVSYFTTGLAFKF
ncbi:MAG: hypothetical protein QM731_11520 [Chitinophagaceae bacterium]